jgi:hypothetical protein
MLKGLCKTIGRDQEEIEKSVVTYIKVDSSGLTLYEILQLCRDFPSVEFRYAIL